MNNKRKSRIDIGDFEWVDATKSAESLYNDLASEGIDKKEARKIVVDKIAEIVNEENMRFLRHRNSVITDSVNNRIDLLESRSIGIEERSNAYRKYCK